MRHRHHPTADNGLLHPFGHFTDKIIDLSGEGPDLHILFGANEAGKSTALAAIEDLLFGIPTTSPFNFKHDYSDMRIGALLGDGQAALEVLRRKGTKDTLSVKEGRPFSGGDSVLRPYLTGADRDFFRRMFSLDHVRLEAGGREILEAGGEIGQTIFSAAAGIGGLRDRITQLAGEADGLWGPKRAKNRVYAQADDKRKAADEILKEQTLTARKWKEFRRAHEKSEAAYQKIEREQTKLLAEGKRLSRIRRVYRDVGKTQDLNAQIEALENVVILPDDSRAVLDEAGRQETDASTHMEFLAGNLELAEGDLEALRFDEALVLRADDVRQLHERRIELGGEKAALPRREAELAAAEKELVSLAGELGWQADKIDVQIGRIPARAKIVVVRTLLAERGELAADVTNRAAVLADAEAGLKDAQSHLDDAAEAADISHLSAIINMVQDAGDAGARLHSFTQRLDESNGLVARALAAMHPNLPGENDVMAIPVPPSAGVQRHRDQDLDWQRRTAEMAQRISGAEGDLQLSRSNFERTIRDESAITAGEIADVRAERDTLWRLVKIKHIEGGEIPDSERTAHADAIKDLAAAFEPAMEAADGLADRRFENAAAAGRLAEISRNIGEQEDQLIQLQKEGELLVDEGEKLVLEWKNMWEASPFEPLAPDAMLEWLKLRQYLGETIEKRAAAKADCNAVQAEVDAGREALLAELASLEIDRAPMEKDDLRVILSRAQEVERAHTDTKQARNTSETAAGIAKTEVETRLRALRQAEADWSDWSDQWSSALDETGLAADLSPQAVAAEIDVIDLTREQAGQINDLRDNRIDKINRDIDYFENEVIKLTGQVAEDLQGIPAEDAILEIENRLKNALRIQEQRQNKEEDIKGLEEEVAAALESRRTAQSSVDHLKEMAGVETLAELGEAVGFSEERRRYEGELEAAIDLLEQTGDGLSINELADECAEIDPDQAYAREAIIETELAELRNQLPLAASARSEAKKEFETIGGDSAAAEAEVQRQEALADLDEVAKKYVRVRTSATLLHWAIDRYRRELLKPLLNRAGALFAVITGGSFTGLSVEYDDQDQAHLAGQRPGGQLVRVTGMSTGAADQLYLALRLASIDDYLERAEALPFIADDLFINFDDDRASSGFEVLGQLAENTQVLFVTHHQHLVDIAQKTLGARIHIVTLADGPTASGP